MRQKYFFTGSGDRAIEMLEWARENNTPMISVVRYITSPKYTGIKAMLSEVTTMRGEQKWMSDFKITLWMRCRVSDYAMLRLRFPENITTDY